MRAIGASRTSHVARRMPHAVHLHDVTLSAQLLSSVLDPAEQVAVGTAGRWSSAGSKKKG
jgi:hypothetical protein